MIKVIIYLISVLLAILGAFVSMKALPLPSWILSLNLAINCLLAASTAGCLYCLRSVYLNRCVHNRWATEWETWYYLRPLTSGISGIAAYLFLKASLIALDASQTSSTSEQGYLALAFLAGLNVDKFILKLEDIGLSIFGIEKSRNAKSSDTTKNQKD